MQHLDSQLHRRLVNWLAVLLTAEQLPLAAEAFAALAKLWRVSYSSTQQLLWSHKRHLQQALQREGIVAAVYGIDPEAVSNLVAALVHLEPSPSTPGTAVTAALLPAAHAIAEHHFTNRITDPDGMAGLHTASSIFSWAAQVRAVDS